MSDMGILLSDIVFQPTRSRKPFERIDGHFVITTLGPATDHHVTIV